ncbi:MAG: hypothetical protein HYT93_00130 [Parcubacteria group bacterium]|nr:hypothetical protein [Parcubacteria group bacterium]
MKLLPYQNILFIAVIIIGGVLLHKNLSSESFLGFSLKKEQKYWSEHMSTKNAEQISEIFQKKYKKLNPAEQHAAAHIVGEAIYKKQSYSGIVFCDYVIGDAGCVHELMTLAILENGLNIIPSINKECLNLPSNKRTASCQHGVGHGILFYLGYDYKSLLKGLEQCSLITAPYLRESVRYVEGCVGGVLMEYNSNPSLNKSQKPRVFALDSVYVPCTSLGEEMRSVCYFWQTQWWNANLKDYNTIGKYKKMGELCTVIVNANEKTWCFRGIAHAMIPDTKWIVKKALHFCNSITLDAGRQECQAYAAFLFKDEGLESVCNFVNDEEKKECVEISSSLLASES